MWQCWAFQEPQNGNGEAMLCFCIAVSPTVQLAATSVTSMIPVGLGTDGLEQSDRTRRASSHASPFEADKPQRGPGLRALPDE